MQDPALREIVQNALTTLAEELGVAVARSAYSLFVNQGPTIATALFDRHARLIAQPRMGLFHCSAIRVSLPELLKDWPIEDMEDGDVFVVNDHFRGGIHPTDVLVVRPIFIEGVVRYFYGAMMIVSDLGGVSAQGLPANATECFHEGLIIPAVRLVKKGEFNSDIVRMIEANSRTPRKVMGDIRALVGGGHVAALRLAELTTKYGMDTITTVLEDVFDRSESLARHGWSKIPDGIYRGTYFVEEDGVEPDKQYWIRVAVKIEGNNLTVDLTGTDGQARGPVNSSFSQSLSGIMHALLFYLDPDFPINEGFFRAFEVELPYGSIVNPKFPAACNNRFGAVQAIVDSIGQALAPVCPEHVQAPGSTPHVVIATAASADTSDAWVLLDVRFGPGGARSTMDGIDCLPDGIFTHQSAYGNNIETYETGLPVRYERFEVSTDSGGPGKWRGGTAVVKEFTLLADAMVTTRIVDRCKIPPQGLAGGMPGRGGGVIVNRGQPGEWNPEPKQTNILLPAGSMITMLVAGGGGYGDPLERDTDAVRLDVTNGMVSIEGARRDYGVVIDPVSGDIDVAATSELRSLARREPSNA